MKTPRSACIAIALCLGACATPKQEPVMLVGYVEEAPPDVACATLMQDAVARTLANGFSLVGNPAQTVRGTAPAGAAREQVRNRHLVPAGSRPAGLTRRRMDGTFQSLYVNCAARKAYISKRGGLTDATYWFGPFLL